MLALSEWELLLFLRVIKDIPAAYSCWALCILLLFTLFVTPQTAAHQTSLSVTISWSLLKFTSIESVMLSNHLILWRPLLLLPSIFPSIRVFFQWVSSSHQGARVLEFQLQCQSIQWLDPRRSVFRHKECQCWHKECQPWVWWIGRAVFIVTC